MTPPPASAPAATLPAPTSSAAASARRREPAQARSFSDRTLLSLLDRAITTVRVRFALPDGDYDIGRIAGATSDEPDYILRIHDVRFFSRIASAGSLGLAECYMEGGWEMERGALEDFLMALLQARVLASIHGSPSLLFRLAALRLRQFFAGTRRNSQDHYDIGDDLYAAFLDETRGYTCGYQRNPGDDSRTLQENKYDRICKKIHLRPGDTLFDVGCGFGGLMIFAAQHFGARCVGITNSVDHGKFAAERTRQLGLGDRVTVHTGDFRAAQGTYDRVVSVGCLEHLFHTEHADFFATFRRLMKPGGFGLVHTIGCVTAKNTPDPFIQKYIFPGSTQNPLSRIVSGFERNELWVLDVENVGRHYHFTTKRWLEAYRANRHTLDPKRYDPRFHRMWELYLCGCVAATIASMGAVFQVVVTNDYRRMLPLHRIGKE